MEVKIIARRTKDGAEQPQITAVRFARENGFILRREPFGKRGSLIEIYVGDKKVGYRKSYRAATAFMEKFSMGKGALRGALMHTAKTRLAIAGRIAAGAMANPES